MSAMTATNIHICSEGRTKFVGGPCQIQRGAGPHIIRRCLIKSSQTVNDSFSAFSPFQWLIQLSSIHFGRFYCIVHLQSSDIYTEKLTKTDCSRNTLNCSQNASRPGPLAIGAPCYGTIGTMINPTLYVAVGTQCCTHTPI